MISTVLDAAMFVSVFQIRGYLTKYYGKFGVAKFKIPQIS